MRRPETSHMWLVNRWRMRQRRSRTCAAPREGRMRPSRPCRMRHGPPAPRQAVLARVRAALQEAQLHQRQRIAVGRRGAHAEVLGDFHDPARAPVRAEAREDRQSPQQRTRQARIDLADRHVSAQPGLRAALGRAPGAIGAQGRIEGLADQRGDARRAAARGRAHHIVDLRGRQLDGDGKRLVFGHTTIMPAAD